MCEYLYIVKVNDSETFEEYEYEYGNFNHAKEHFNMEENAVLIRYFDGSEIVLETK